MAAPVPSGEKRKETFQYKIVLLGESGVGKSNMVLQFVKGQFHEGKESTIGAAFLSHSLDLEDRIVKFEIWDTAGQERYHSLAPMYYRGAQAAVVVYDITDEASFEKAKNWIKELLRQASPNILIMLAGNKYDLAETQRRVSSSDVAAYAEENKILFMETSAKTAHNVAPLFRLVADKLPRIKPASGPFIPKDVVDPAKPPVSHQGGCPC